MIPVRLEIRNFLPYRAPDPLRFDGIHLACLTGANGAGKSSILDAITWALWGHARAKRDEDLIHQGQDDMHVILDFEQEGIYYRVIRRRSRSKRSSTGTLDLLVRSPDGQFKTINEPSMRATQDKINFLLRLDYETFVHSAFLQQGKADAFTTQTPARRKQILGEILGLAQWEQYEDRVKEHLKDLEKQLVYCDTRISEINTELARKPALMAEQIEADRTYQEAHQAWELAQKRLDEIRDAPINLKNTREKKADAERRRREHQRDLEAVIDQIARHEKQITDYDEIIAMRDEIVGGYAALQNARDTDQSLNAKLTDLMNLDKRRADLNSQISAVRIRLESEAEALERSITDLEQMVAAQPGNDLEAVQAEVDALKTVEMQRDELNERDNQLREELAAYRTNLDTIKAEGVKMNERLNALQSTDDAICPVCGQPLDAEHRQQLITQLTDEIEAHRAAWAERNTYIKEMEKQRKEANLQVKTVEANLKQLPTLLENAGKLQAQIDAASQAAIRLEEDVTRQEAVIAQLHAEDFALDIRDALAELDTEQDALGYDKSTHDATRRSLDEYRRYEQLQTRLAIALESLPAIEEAMSGAKIRQERLNEALEQIDEQLNALEIEIAGLLVQVEEYNQREQEVRAQHTRRNSAYERLVNIQQALSSLEAQAARKVELEQRRERYRHEEGVYKELKTAFGRNGIPAMIIETAIPELEVTANELLMRMTDGRMNLRLTTQKEKITGGVQETLDIEIADELGTRSYEMYSGGEAFRINFAIRVALSQMLARRAGAHLRTLFIDEGFGTQDDEGRSRLVEAITAIQDDFDLILVITHIDELRDSFPVHVVVEKTSSGSMVSVR